MVNNHAQRVRGGGPAFPSRQFKMIGHCRSPLDTAAGPGAASAGQLCKAAAPRVPTGRALRPSRGLGLFQINLFREYHYTGWLRAHTPDRLDR